MRWGAVAATVVLVLFPLVGAAGGSSPSGSASDVLAITQSPGIVTEHGALTVDLELASSANVKQIYYTFCSLTSYVCYFPNIAMTPHGGNWFQGSTQRMANYSGMTVGARAGYNITIVFNDNSTVLLPSLPNRFANLSLAQTVSGEWVYAMTVSNPVFGLTGTVTNQATGSAIVGAQVSITPGNAPASVTSASGAYAFANLPNGTYTLSVAKTGFRTSSVSVTIAGQDAVQNVAISDGSHPSNGQPWGSLWSFITTPLGLGSAVAIILVGLLAAWAAFSRTRKRADRPPPAASAADPSEPTPPTG